MKTFPEGFDPEISTLRIIDHYIAETRLRLHRMEFTSGETLILKLDQNYHGAGQKAYQRIMTNICLTEVEYQTLAVLSGSSIIKRRYPYQYAGNDYSIDVFEANLDGLILMEIESLPERDILSLPIPGFTAREVTDDLLFTSRNLAELSREEFQRWLSSW